MVLENSPDFGQAERFFKELADNAPVMIWRSGLDKLCDWFNKPWLDFVGRTMEQELGNGWAENVHPDDFERCLKIYVGSFDVRERFSMIYRLRRSDGVYREILDNGAPFYRGGTFAGYFGSCIVVTDLGDLRARTAELTRSVGELQALEEVLRAVNSSLDLDTVLATIISRAAQLSKADEGTIYEFDETEQVFVLKSAFGMSADRVAALRQRRVRLGETYLGRAAVERAPVHVEDVQQDDPTLTGPDRAGLLEGIHAALAVPLLREDKVVGGLVIRRRTVGGFAPTIPTLLQTFAGQAVLAIENARLFEELKARGEEARRARTAAEAALADLRRAQDRLIHSEKMASLGQLTAGIAHEIKNPLNFVNNFAGLSVELLDELKETADPGIATLDEYTRAEIDETIHTLTGNLEKITEHGRRADGIVKSMLEHSRGVSGERREVDLNALVEDALSLAYHGARAQDTNFTIMLERDLDPAVAAIELAPQEMTRVFLNLFGNGFYAAAKRARGNGEAAYWPTLKVSTRDLGEAVEVRVRDNGVGIPPEIRDQLFQPFFTTKPTGEGTGLGLSISWDIVTQQHGGTIEVDSEPGEFSEFTIRLPRNGQDAGVQRMRVSSPFPNR
jgi:PAS domain S-box-containing protein